MKNLTDNEIAKLKDILFKWAESENLQEWASAVSALIKLGEISTQEAQSQALTYMQKAMKVIDQEEKKNPPLVE